MSASEWTEPDVPASELAYQVASSVVEQFAQGHTIADVLRELVQNEYDAGGSSLYVDLGTDGLTARGSGRVIDRGGWRRLSVMLGTGRVVGDDREIPQKVNGIGSKNFGVRALFLIGDRIYVRSGGLQTLLDLSRGALREPRPDEASRGVPGAHIYVPYRTAPDGLLEAYGSTREARDVDLLADELAPTLLKLADPKAPRSLRSVTVSSETQHRVLQWRQRVVSVRRHRLRGALLQRTIELKDTRTDSGSTTVQRTTELEYQRVFTIPQEYSQRPFPAYFRVSGGRLRIGVSIRITRKRPIHNSSGSFFYPLGLARSATGCALSVSAPFELNSDRSELVDAGISSWNRWLLETAADLALNLLTAEWLDSFGAAGYLVLDQTSQPSTPFFSEVLRTGLAKRECWPTRARAKPGSKRPKLTSATQIKVGASSYLDVLFADTRRLDERLVVPAVLAMVRDAGAQDFTIASAVRLRCAGKDEAGQLETKVENAANLYFENFPAALRDPDRQERFAEAFEVHRRQLTPANRNDLRTAATTLTAAGTLDAPQAPLWVVDSDIADVAPLKPERLLHPRLVRYGAIKRLCKPFDTSSWARQVATEATEGRASEEDREALYRHLLRAPESISRPTWPTIRESPVVKDHRGEWSCPSELVQRRTAGATRIEAALHFPSSEIRNPRLLRSLRIRSKLKGSDLVRQARLVVGQSEMAEEFEQALYQLRPLLTGLTIRQLRSIAFLKSTQGMLVEPRRCYVRSAELLSSVGPDANFAAGPHTSLHGRLGCATTPDPDDVVKFLAALREVDQAPARPDVLYPALVDGLRGQGDTARFADEPILFDGRAWHAPSDTLLGKKHRAIFDGAVPVVDTVGLVRTYEALGAKSEPASHHWLRFFGWVDQESAKGKRRLPPKTRKALTLAYSKLGSFPVNVPVNARVLLDTDGFLHSQTDARGGRFVINDDPIAARIAAERLLPVTFAVRGDAATRRFLQSAGVQRLTEARRHVGAVVGGPRPAPRWFQESAELERLHRATFASAVHAVAAISGSRTSTAEQKLRRTLRGITRLVFVTSIDDKYRIVRTEFTVPADVAIDGPRVVLTFVRSKSELYGSLARAVATLAESTDALQQPLADSVFRILSCESVMEIERYLSQRGVAWSAQTEAAGDLQYDEEDEIESRAQIGETLKDELILAAARRAGTSGPTPGEQRSHDNAVDPSDAALELILPSLEDVALNELAPVDWTPAERIGGSGGGGGGGWRPRTPAEQEADRILGQRGEELVYQRELERVRALGYPEASVTWTSKVDPAADHDIHSVADDGGDLWLEVKATTGRHGRFDWSRAEFELAIRARERYALCRVYEVESTSPTMLRETDPVGKFLRGEMRLDLSSLVAELTPLPE